MRRHPIARGPAAAAVLAVLVAATYLHTLDVPWYLDDYSSILENGVIYEWQGFEALRQFAPLRVVTYASFVLNHRLGHFDPRGYHLVNIAIHFLAGLAVYGLARGLLRTPRLAGGLPPAVAAGLPLVAAALFLAHPLQTQAVTYIVQRLASLVGMLYVAALAGYVQARLATSTVRRGLWATASLLGFLLALFSKENSATFPVAVVLVELVFFRHRLRAVPGLALAGAGGLALVWLAAALAHGGDPLSLRSLGELTSQSDTLRRDVYLATQMPILWDYLRLFVLPVGLHLDHAPGPLRGFGDGAVWLALSGHLAVAAVALGSWRRRPMVTFGLLFYYLAHGVESAVIPIPELAFEHRTYLPNLGLCLLAAWLLVAELPRRVGAPRVAVPVIVLVALALGIMTWRRNQAWRDPLALWRDNTQLAPSQPRAWGNLGKHLVAAGRPEEGIAALRESIRLRERGEGPATLLALDAVNLADALHRLGRDGEALGLLDGIDTVAVEPFATAMIHVNRGNIQFAGDRLGEAEASFRAALTYMPHSLPARANVASVLAQTGRLAAAESLYVTVLAADPANALVRRNLLQARLARRLDEAEAARLATPDRARAAAVGAMRAWEELVRHFPEDSVLRPDLPVLRPAPARPE